MSESDRFPSNFLYPALAVLSLLLFAYIRSVAQWEARTQGRSLPPGPKGLPILGNVLNFPNDKPWITHQKLSQKYGNILYYRLFGQSIVVLGNASVINELLEKRSANTSDRKQSPMIELSGGSLNFALMPYGQWWRRHRRAFWQHYYPRAALEHRPTQRRFAHMFLKMVLDDPSNIIRHIRCNFAGVMLKVAYGLAIDECDEDYYYIADTALEGATEGLLPGRFLVEYFPFLRYIPIWFPGAYSQRLFAKWQDAANRMKNVPYRTLKASFDNGDSTARETIVGKLLDQLSGRNTPYSAEEEEDLIKDIGAVSFKGGADTVYSTLQFMILAMSLHPEALDKVHAELDAIVGADRLPDFSDQDKLVYVQAVIKETMRWRNILPLGVPHYSMEDDDLNGYFIPAGTILIPNTWACMHDPDVYPEPDSFRPERFIRNGKLDESIRDPAAFVFGYGRRLCPGRYFAEAGLFITVASLLHVFNITPPIGQDGLPIEIVPEATDGLNSYPEDCRCTITPRSSAAEELIRTHALFYEEVAT